MEPNLNEARNHFNKSRELIKQGRYDEALKELDKAIELDPKTLYYLILYAMLEANLGSLEKGINKIKDLIKSGVVDRDELCIQAEITEVLEEGEEELDEKEMSALREIKK